MKKTLPKLSGVALALTAASLVSGCASTANTAQSVAKKVTNTATVDLVHCSGVNKCKGHNDCKTASNACGGHASCEGKGYVFMPEKACNDVGGSVTPGGHHTVSKAELIQCSGANICKGHNDCKTASNACAGHAKCKGAGFVNTTKKSCDDIGGTS